MPAMKSLVAALVAALSGFAVVRTGKAMMRDPFASSARKVLS